jgi:uncharacterized protein (TIGR04551 family)
MRRSSVTLISLALLAAPTLSFAQTPPGSTTTAEPEEASTSTAPREPEEPAENTATPSRANATETPTEAATTASPAPRAQEPPTDLLDRIGQMFVLHGYLRVRPELQHNFGLGWDNPALLPYYTDPERAPWITNTTNPPANLQGMRESGSNWPWARNPDNGLPALCPTATITGRCENGTQTMANMRLRLAPEIHVTDNISVHTQVDIFDNLILGSTPQGYESGTRSPWAPIAAMSGTQVAPRSSISVQRAWAEANNATLGQIRFGRMPFHWGLGILANQGNGVDSDFQTHMDRLMYTAHIRPASLYLSAMYDFAATGLTSQTQRYETGQGQPIDLSQLDDVTQIGLSVVRRMEASEARRALARGNVIWNAGLWSFYRYQILSSEGVAAETADPVTGRFLRRDARIFSGDIWFQLLHRSFRIEFEAALQGGYLSLNDIPGTNPQKSYDVFQLGAALEFEYRLLNNRLQIEFRTGYASGDADLEGLNYHTPGTTQASYLPRRAGAQALTLFRFHPDYRVDLILWRQIFRQVSGAYYFRPSLMYAFVDRPGGERFYGRASVIWSRAAEFVQTRGNAADLGIELNAELTYMTNYRDPSLGARPAPGFFASLQYGILFPMAGLGPRDSERVSGQPFAGFSFNNAQTLRGVLGVMF